MKRVGIIGCLADGYDMYDGQTVSTRLWRDELRPYSEKKMVEVDTYEYKKNIVKLLVSIVKCILTCSHIVFMLSGNGLRILLPILYYAKIIFKKKIYHRVIGGELDSFIIRNPKCFKYINGMDVTWVQSPKLVEKLKEQGITNANYLENFRNIVPIDITKEVRYQTEPFRFCTFCRVSVPKGIREAISSIVEINFKYGKVIATLDIYGPVDESFSDEFYSLIRESENVSYKGCVQSHQAVDVLKDYYMHLFPTTWSGEGFPGALIDCYNAALPTIATDWAYNAEYIKEGKTGYLYPWSNHDNLTVKIEYAIEHPEEVYNMRKNCLIEAKRYTSGRVMKKIISFMNGDKE